MEVSSTMEVSGLLLLLMDASHRLGRTFCFALGSGWVFHRVFGDMKVERLR